MVDMSRLYGVYRRVTRSLMLAAVAVLVVLLVSFASLAVLSHEAPPPVEPQDVEYDDPAGVAFDAAHNLRASQYRYHVRVERAEAGESLRTVAVQHVAVDNRAHAYRGRGRDGAAIDNASIAPVRYYGTLGSGYTRVPAGFGGTLFTSPSDGSWRKDDGFRYAPHRNAFEEVERLRGAPATVLVDNETTYAVRVTDADVAIDVTDQRSAYPAANATANLTFVVDRSSGNLRRAMFRYHDVRREVHVRITYRFERFGRALVTRPPGTLPGQPLEPFYRADLGLRVLWNPVTEVFDDA